jgi:hypothetical protein
MWGEGDRYSWQQVLARKVCSFEFVVFWDDKLLRCRTVALLYFFQSMILKEKFAQNWLKTSDRDR